MARRRRSSRYRELCAEVSRAFGATRWRAPPPRRLRRSSCCGGCCASASAPYFVLGAGRDDVIRLRIDTPWDWRQRFDLRAFDIEPDDAGQPQVRWAATVTDREAGADAVVAGPRRGALEPRPVRGSARGQGVPRHARRPRCPATSRSADDRYGSPAPGTSTLDGLDAPGPRRSRARRLAVDGRAHVERAAVRPAEHAGEGLALVAGADLVEHLAALGDAQHLVADGRGHPDRALGVEADAVGHGAARPAPTRAGRAASRRRPMVNAVRWPVKDSPTTRVAPSGVMTQPFGKNSSSATTRASPSGVTSTSVVVHWSASASCRSKPKLPT